MNKDIRFAVVGERRNSEVSRSDAWVLDLQGDKVELLGDAVVGGVPHAGADLLSWRHQSEGIVVLLGVLPHLRHVERLSHLFQRAEAGEVIAVHVAEHLVQLSADSLGIIFRV